MSGDISSVSKDHADILYQAMESMVVGKGAGQLLDPEQWLKAIKDPTDTTAVIDQTVQTSIDAFVKA